MAGLRNPRSVRGPRRRRATRRRSRWRALIGTWRRRHHPDLHEGADGGRGAHAPHQRGVGGPVQSGSPRRLRRVAPVVGRSPSSGHWAASRSPIQPASPSSTRTWATWRATAAETRAAPRTVRQPGEIPTPANAAPAAAGTAEPSFRTRAGRRACRRVTRCCWAPSWRVASARVGSLIDSAPGVARSSIGLAVTGVTGRVA